MRSRAFLGVLLTLLALNSPALAQGRHAPEFGYDVRPLDRILPGVRNGRPGRFFDADGPYPDAFGGMHYRIKWLTPGGRVVWLDTDARTGRVLGPIGGDLRPMPPSGLRFGGPMGPLDGRFGGPPGRFPHGGWGRGAGFGGAWGGRGGGRGPGH